MANHLTRERELPSQGCAVRTCLRSTALPTTCTLFLLSGWKADLAIPTAFDPHVRSLQNQNSEWPRVDHYPQPTAQNLLFVGRENVPVGNIEDYIVLKTLCQPPVGFQ